MRRRRLARGVLCAAAACLLGAGAAAGPTNETLRRERDVIFTAEETVRLRPPAMCDRGLEVDTLRAWTPTEVEVRDAARLRWAKLYSDARELEPLAKERDVRQFFGIYCGGQRRLQMVSMRPDAIRYTEVAMEPSRPRGYAGPLWRVLPFEDWGDLEPWISLVDPDRGVVVRGGRVAWAHRGVFAPAGPPVGGTCIALGFGPWTSWGADWLPLGWEERFPHLQLNPQPTARGTHLSLRLAPHSPRPARPTVFTPTPVTSENLGLDGWRAPGPDSLSMSSARLFEMHIRIDGRWHGDTLLARVVSSSDAIAPGYPEADAFAVRYPCDDARAAAAADAAMERLRSEPRISLPRP